MFCFINKKKRIYVYLTGGLGNQMFQYAAAKSLALRHNAELVVDNWSGFIRDYEYHRHYELGALPIDARKAHPWERMPIWLYRLWHRQAIDRTDIIQRYWYGNFITETKFTYQPQLKHVDLDRSTWLIGYWQSPLYFQSDAATLCSELMPPTPIQSKFLNLGDQILSTEAVSLGVRLYEESEDPSAHAHGGQIKSVVEIRSAVERMKKKMPNSRFFIFCTHRSELLQKLDLPDNSVYVTHDDGYEGTLESLWLMSRCQHHIITNSSFYWWGAWLSTAIHGEESQYIMAADNFVNRDALLPSWVTF